MSENKERLTYRPEAETRQKIERWYKQDNCRSKNEFIEKAVNFYADYLSAEDSTMLPRTVRSAIDGRLKLFEDRMAALRGRGSALLRAGKSIAAVKRTNGRLRLEQKLRELENEEWQD